MKTGLRKILIGSAALFLLIALVAPGISATTAPNTSADAYSTDSSGSSYVPPSTQPPVSATDPMSQPNKEAEPEVEIEEPSGLQLEIQPIMEIEPVADGEAEPENQPAPEGEAEPAPAGAAEPESEPEEILPDIPSMDTNPDEPDSSYPTFQKGRAKSNPQRHGNSGNVKKTK